MGAITFLSQNTNDFESVMIFLFSRFWWDFFDVMLVPVRG